VSLLIGLLGREEVRDRHEFIRERLLGPLSQAVPALRVRLQEHLPQGESEAERRRREAAQRKQQILAQFAQRQHSFEAHLQPDEEEELELGEEPAHAEEATCALCREPGGPDRPLAQIGSAARANLLFRAARNSAPSTGPLSPDALAAHDALAMANRAACADLLAQLEVCLQPLLPPHSPLTHTYTHRFFRPSGLLC
jgi:hypothetical protein